MSFDTFMNISYIAAMALAMIVLQERYHLPFWEAVIVGTLIGGAVVTSVVALAFKWLDHAQELEEPKPKS